MSVKTKKLTGRKVLIITLMAFGTVIGANLALVYFALGSFPGLEVKNTYVASQNFDKERAAQQALGWRTSAEYDGQFLRVKILGENATPASVQSITATVGRATHNREDRVVDLVFDGSVHKTPLSLPAGNWQLRMTAFAPDGTPFRQRLPLYVEK